MKPQRLFGPYGTALAEIGEQTGRSDLSHPVSILNGSGYGDAVTSVARGYLERGRAEIGTVGAFGLRGLLRTPGDLPVYRAALHAHHAALKRAIDTASGITRSRIQIAISFGPQEDCYDPSAAPGRLEATDFHGTQAAHAAELNPDTAWFETVNTTEEAVGIALASRQYNVPCMISFVLNREGKLLNDESLQDAIRAVDSASGKYPIGYSLNCCPIEALEPALKSAGRYDNRVIGAYPNASSLTPNELEGTEGVVGVRNPEQTAHYLNYLASRFNLRIIGGCCGFDKHHIGQISYAVKNGHQSPHLPQTDRPKTCHSGQK